MGRIQRAKMALIVPQSEFQHILRVLNTNIDGRHKVPFAITAIRGIGRRFANIICKKAEIDPNKRAGDLGPDEIEKIVTIINRPLQFIPPWMVNRTKDIKDGKTTHVCANNLDSKLRDSLELLEDQGSSWSPSRMGSACSWTEDMHYWP